MEKVLWVVLLQDHNLPWELVCLFEKFEVDLLQILKSDASGSCEGRWKEDLGAVETGRVGNWSW